MPLRSRRYGAYVLGLLAAVNLLNYANRNVVFHKRVYDDLRVAFEFTSAELGLLGTAFMIPHALVTLPLGWLGDRLPRRAVMTTGIGVWSAAAIAGAFTPGLTSLLMTRAIAGIGCAACVPVANALLCEVFPGDGKASTVSTFNLGLFLGGVAGFAVGFQFGYPYGFIIAGLPGVLLAVLVYRLDLPKQRSLASTEHRIDFADFVLCGLSTFRISALRRMFVGAVLMAFAAGGYLAWFTEFLESVKGLSPNEAALVFGAALVGGLFGVMAGGFIGDRFHRRLVYGRQLAIATGFLCAVPCALVTIQFAPGALFYASCFGLMFFVSWYHGPVAAAVDDLVPADTAATAQGVYIFLMHLFGTAPSSYIVGVLADDVGLGTALYLPTIAMLGAGLIFLWSCPRVAAVVKA